MIFKPPRINFPITALDVKNLQDFINNVMEKVFGNIEFGDLSSGTGKLINSKLSLINYQTFEDVANGPIIITLPDEFKGKQFKTIVAVSSVYPKYDTSGFDFPAKFVRQWSAEVYDEDIDYVNGTYKVWVSIMASTLTYDSTNGQYYFVDDTTWNGGMNLTVTTIA